MKSLIDEVYNSIVKKNEGYLFLFRDNVYIPLYRNDLLITKREVIKLNLVEEKTLQIIQNGVYQVNEIAKILGLNRRMLEITIADLTTRDMIAVVSEKCQLLAKGKEAVNNLERVEKRQDILKNVYMDGIRGDILPDVFNLRLVENPESDDGKLKAVFHDDDLNQIISQFNLVNRIFQETYADGSSGITHTVTHEMLTIDKVERTYVTFIQMPICVYVSSNGLDIDLMAAKEQQSELLNTYKDEILRQLRGKMVLKSYFSSKHFFGTYQGEQLAGSEDLFRKIKTMHFTKNKDETDIDVINKEILSSRKLFDGEADIIIRELASNSKNVELQVHSLDDWAYNRHFVGALSWLVGKSAFCIKYQHVRNKESAFRLIKRGYTNRLDIEQCDVGYYICWRFDNQVEVYGIPSLFKVIDDHTYCIAVNYYLKNSPVN